MKYIKPATKPANTRPFRGLQAPVCRFFLECCLDQVRFMRKLLVSDSHRAALRLGIPLGVVERWFPRLYPEAA
jgi:hypothetical protein